ncbi:hypothetical protein EVA_08146 [gut metagenome]|uniref:Uncharacterized protein n=1 Tax=gut metagenome TaxID=749906 RepID=J9GA76_9ZZZZ
MIETILIIIKHTLHRIVWSDLCDRVLDILNPVWRVTLTILSIISWDDLSLKHVIYSCSVKLILVLLVLISALVGQRPACALNITLIPPAIKN